jgi:GAF domain-containing protein
MVEPPLTPPETVALLEFLNETLQIIEDTGSADELRDLRAALGSKLSSDEARADAESAYERAVRLRESLSEHRRREQELRALVDTAADLSSHTDLDAVLAAVCRRGRSLLGTDAAWITLVDSEQGGTYHCMTDGIVAEEEVRTFRLTAGTGLGGLVLETGHAEWTDDYLTDGRFTHSPSIDRSTRDEGLTAMLGAPMKRGDELLGIVITGNRSHKRFTAHDVTLLQSLADYAAIAIANARELTMSLESSADLRAAYETLRRRAEGAERVAVLQTHLSRLVLAGTDLQTLATTVAELLDGMLTIVDADRRILACGGTAPEESEDVFVPMLAGNEPLGDLHLQKRTLTDEDLASVRAAALPVALYLTHQRAQADAERVVRGELLDDLIDGRSLSPDVLARRAGRIGWDPHGAYVLVVADFGDADAHRVRLAGGRFVAERRGLMTERAGRLVLLLPAAEPDDLVADLSHALRVRDGAQPTIAVGRRSLDPGRIPEAHEEAQQALTLALALGHRGGTVFAERADALGIILGSTRPDQLAEFIDRTVGRLLDHDRDRDSDLVSTLETWFECDGHMGNTASAAHIHVNTLYRRLDRIDELLGNGWRSPDERLQVQLALRLRRLASDLGRIT